MCGPKSRPLPLLSLSLCLCCWGICSVVAEERPPLTEAGIQQMTPVQLVERLRQNNERLQSINAGLLRDNSELRMQLEQALQELSGSRAASMKAAESWTRTSELFVVSLNSQAQATAQAARDAELWQAAAIITAAGFGGYLSRGWPGAGIGAGMAAIFIAGKTLIKVFIDR